MEKPRDLPSTRRPEVAEHLLKHKFPIDNHNLRRRCGDGRDESDNGEAILGGDLGYLYATVAAIRRMKGAAYGGSEETRKITQGLFDFLGDVYVHSDKKHGGLIDGCGFNAKAKLHQEEFGLSAEDFEIVEGVIKAQPAEKVHRVEYEDDHTEMGVVMVRGNRYSIKARDTEKRESSVFVISVDLIQERIRQIAGALAGGLGLDQKNLEEEIRRSQELQSNIVAGELAAGLEIFDLTFDDSGKITFKDAGRIPKKEA